MASNYTEESLKSYNKQQLIKLFIKLLKENYKKLESDMSVSKTVSGLLNDQINNVERQCWVNAQYPRHECLEDVDIPSSVNIKDLQGKFRTVFNRIGVAVKPDDIEACHILCNDKKIIVTFSKRKLCHQVLRVKNDLKNTDPSEFDFPEGTDIIINESLCSYYKMLWNKCKKLW